MSAQLDYWAECVASALEEHGVTATHEQIAAIAKDIQLSHENYGMAFYSPPASELPVFGELREARKELERERSKVPCRVCDGKGMLVTHGPHHSSMGQCWKCGGRGRHDP